jgi:hypothetical protein
MLILCRNSVNGTRVQAIFGLGQVVVARKGAANR